MFRGLIILALVVAFAVGPALARKARAPLLTADPPHNVGPFDSDLPVGPRFALAAANTTVLASFSFDSGATCDDQGWTVVDATAVPGTFWHVDDFVGANVNPGDSLEALAGTQSLWCGARAPTCDYGALPGYGNGWNQAWQTKTCIPVTGDLDVAFLMETDSEPDFDATFLEYTSDCDAPFEGWQQLDGGLRVWDGRRTISHVGAYPVAGNPIKVRLRFQSDGAYSDEDELFDSHAGAVVIDNLAVEGLALEDFEDESVGATESNDWEFAAVPGYGSYFALFPGATLVQEGDACTKDLSCVWAAIQGSTETYACGGFPNQAAVPKVNDEGLYIDNEIWSPMIPLVGSGSVITLRVAQYDDFTLDSLVFPDWAVRAIDAGGCFSPWRNRGFFFYFGKGWHTNTYPVGDLVPATAVAVQLSVGVFDMCGAWCGIYGTGACHSHTPLYDNVKVYRVDISGPFYTIRDIDMFQDTFPSDGTDTGFGRADCAQSLIPNTSPSPTIQPGDSVFFNVVDPVTSTLLNPSGLMDDGATKAVYCWTRVVGDIGKTNLLFTTYGGKDQQVADGKTWTRMPNVPIDTDIGRFSFDLPDDVLFSGGDVVEFFFGATNTNGETTYCSGSALNYVQSDVDIAAETAAEFSILPVNGNGTSGNDILYVDGMDGRGAQVYWDTAFEQLGLNPDRYDVRGPSSGVCNRPGSRVRNVAAQLNANYHMIIWDCGDLSVTLGGGGADPVLLDKSNDFGMLNTFLDGLATTGGVYICGDDFPQRLAATTNGNAGIFSSTHVTYVLTTNDHRPTYGVAPAGIGAAQGAFAGDTWVVHGGCPILNDFDVMVPTGSSVMHSSYNAQAANNGAEIGRIDGLEKVMISGYSFIYIRDDEADGTLDRAQHLYDILTWLTGTQAQPTDTKPVAVDRLEQNYPNPFNPQTTIAFSLKQRGRVRIDVYNVAGQHVRTLLDETRAAGSYSDVRWDGTDNAGQPVASGVYLYRLVAGDFSATRKLVLLK